MGIYQFRPTAELKPNERAILMQLLPFTTAKNHMIFGLDLNPTTVSVGVDSPNPGVLAKGRLLGFPREPFTTPRTG